MAKKIQKKKARSQKQTESPFNIYWEKNNYLILLLGVVFIVVGFYFMSQGPWDSTASLVVSPVFLFIGYILIFPLSIFYRRKKEENINQEKNSASGQS